MAHLLKVPPKITGDVITSYFWVGRLDKMQQRFRAAKTAHWTMLIEPSLILRLATLHCWFHCQMVGVWWGYVTFHHTAPQVPLIVWILLVEKRWATKFIFIHINRQHFAKTDFSLVFPAVKKETQVTNKMITFKTALASLSHVMGQDALIIFQALNTPVCGPWLFNTVAF